MRIAVITADACWTFGALVACAQPGDPRPSPETDPAAAPATTCADEAACRDGAAGRSPTQLQPSVPAVPDSPLQVNCERLPTQIERDTCINRKLTTT